MKTILLDNGHGVETPGKRSPIYDGRQLFEWEFNRDIVNRIWHKSTAAGINVIRLVPETEDVPLSKRVARANAYYQELNGKCIFVSIHANAGGGSGFEVFTSPGKTEADEIAQKWAEFARKTFPGITLRTDTSDGDLDKENGFYVLIHTRMPAILTENLFMDNRKDFELLMSDAFREELADMYIRFFQAIV